MRFLADMGVHRGLVDWLEAQNHEVTHLRDLGLQTLPDRQIFEKARELADSSTALGEGAIVIVEGGTRVRRFDES